MVKALRLSLYFALLGVLFVGTGCAGRKKTTKQISALEAQVGVLTDELTRVDQQLQETRAGVPSQPQAAATSRGAQGGTYRTPSGFELPSISIQKALQSAGYYKGTLDGKVGPGTREAVKAFQRDNGLEPDGVVGRQTWDKLKTYLGAVK